MSPDLTSKNAIFEDLFKTNFQSGMSMNLQNNNDNFNQFQITPKVLPTGSKIVDIAVFAAACIFNEATSALM